MVPFSALNDRESHINTAVKHEPQLETRSSSQQRLSSSFAVSQETEVESSPPIVPKVSHEGDTSNFDVYPEEDWKKDPPVPQKDLDLFKNF